VGVLHSQLMLIISYKTSILFDRQLKIHVSKQQFLENDVLLVGDLLEEIFPPPGPDEETLHIVVRLPHRRESSL